MPLLTWQVWLARQDCIESILAAIGTPVPPPKPRSKSPGRAKGVKPAPRPRYPRVKKRVSKRQKPVPSLRASDSIGA